MSASCKSGAPGPQRSRLFKSSLSSRFISSVTNSHGEMRFIPLQRGLPFVLLPELVISPSSSSLGFCQLPFLISPPPRPSDPLVLHLFSHFLFFFRFSSVRLSLEHRRKQFHTKLKYIYSFVKLNKYKKILYCLRPKTERMFLPRSQCVVC